jgi:transposase InsO family protein
LITVVPYTIHTAPTDNGTSFVDHTPAPVSSRKPETMAEGPLIYRRYAFEYACEQHAIEHRLTRAHHPWINGQAERMNWMLKETLTVSPLPSISI